QKRADEAHAGDLQHRELVAGGAYGDRHRAEAERRQEEGKGVLHASACPRLPGSSRLASIMAEGGTQGAATRIADRGPVAGARLAGALLAALLLLTAASVRCIWGHDFWWQWRAGEIIASEGLPTVDTLSYTRQGFRWIEMHWLYCLGLYHLFNTFGPAAPIPLPWLHVGA